MVDAMGRTLFRLFIRRRHLLEWVTSSQSNDDSEFDRRTLAAQIAASAAFVGLAAVGSLLLGPRDMADRGTVCGPVGAVPACRAMGEFTAARGRPSVGHA